MELKTYKKQNDFVEKTVGDELVIVPLVGAVAQMDKVFTLNKVGAFIMDQLNDPKNTEEISEAIIAEFEIDKLTAIRDLEHFLSEAVIRGIITEG